MPADARWCNTANRILPLVSSAQRCSNPARRTSEQTADPVQVIVFNDGDRSVGVVVDQILDVAEEAVTVRQKIGRKGLLGSAVVGKQVTDFLDLNDVIRAAAETWFQGASGAANGKTILIAEASAFSRGLIRSGLDMAGYRVVEAANLDEAIRGLEQHPVDVVGRGAGSSARWQLRLCWPPCSAAGVAERFRSWRWPIRPSRSSAAQRPVDGFPGLPGEVRPRGHARIAWRGWPRRWLPAEATPECCGREEK